MPTVVMYSPITEDHTIDDVDASVGNCITPKPGYLIGRLDGFLVHTPRRSMPIVGTFTTIRVPTS
jgi:hypothetical protein